MSSRILMSVSYKPRAQDPPGTRIPISVSYRPGSPRCRDAARALLERCPCAPARFATNPPQPELWDTCRGLKRPASPGRGG